MFCKNCGKEIKEGSAKCEFCGQILSESIVDKSSLEKVKIKLKCSKKVTLIISVVCLLLVGMLIVFKMIPNTPKLEQLKTDFSNDIFDREEYVISEFDVVSETDGKERQYKAIIDVVYDDGTVEYQEQYELIYNKYSDWIFESCNSYKKEKWESHPIISPEITDCEKELKEYGFDAIKQLEEKSKIDLKNGEAKIYFRTETNKPIGKTSGDIEISMAFDFDEKKWIITNQNVAENFVVKTDFLKKWGGSSKPIVEKSPLGAPYDTETFSIKITELDEINAKAILLIGDKEYKLSGTIEKNDTFGFSHSVYLRCDNNAISVEGELYLDGNFDAKIYTHPKGLDERMYGDIARAYIYKLTMNLK